MQIDEQGSLRAVVLDDGTDSRAGLIAILGAESSLVVSAAVATQAEAIEAAGQYRAEVLVASAEYWQNGLFFDAVADFVAGVQVPVVLVARSLNAQIIRQARGAAAAGLISKRASAPAIRGAVHAAAAGASVFPRIPKGSLANPPSGREQHIISRVADGRTNDEIAGALGLRDAPSPAICAAASSAMRCHRGRSWPCWPSDNDGSLMVRRRSGFGAPARHDRAHRASYRRQQPDNGLVAGSRVRAVATTLRPATNDRRPTCGPAEPGAHQPIGGWRNQPSAAANPATRSMRFAVLDAMLSAWTSLR